MVYATLIGPNRLSLFFEGLFFFRLIPPAIVKQNKFKQMLCKVSEGVSNEHEQH